MNLDTVKEIIRRKPLFFLLVSVGYLVLTAFLKWDIHPTGNTLLFFLGGILGVYFMDIAEVFFQLTPSPFRSIVFVGAFALVSLFVVTSAGSALASGLVLSLYLSLIFWQVGQWQIQHNLNDWYRMVTGIVNTRVQRWILVGFVALFLGETFVFIR